MELLNKVLAQQKSTNEEPRAGADETFDVWSVCVVYWHRDGRFHCFLPVGFEVFPPFRELAESANIDQHYFKFLVKCWCELRD